MHLHHDAVVAQLAGAHAKDAGVDQDAQPLHVGAEGPGLGLGPRAARVHRRQAHQRRRHQLHTQQVLISKEVTSEVTLGSAPPASTAGRHTSDDATSTVAADVLVREGTGSGGVGKTCVDCRMRQG